MNIFFRPFHSLYRSLQVTFDRNLDHLYRKIIGVPTLKRSMITSQLYLGGQYSSRGFSILKKRGITAIVSMRSKARTGLPDLGEVRFLHLQTKDHAAPTLSQLKEGSEFIQKEIDRGGVVYVHCAHGEGRGPSMVIAYLISTGLTLDAALEQVQSVRAFARPTKPQMERLREFEHLHVQKTTTQ